MSAEAEDWRTPERPDRLKSHLRLASCPACPGQTDIQADVDTPLEGKHRIGTPIDRAADAAQRHQIIHRHRAWRSTSTSTRLMKKDATLSTPAKSSPPRDPLLQTGHEGFEHCSVAIDGEDQCDVDADDRKHVSTSFVKRHNLTMRMSMRRFTRLTNAFSKKLDNHIHALALYFAFYNFLPHP